ncbi:P-loop containing nucleoside triphosphate hydrolase protein [Xylaria palmicola]|nr:P-loop containing nucleoside triphosphate hydrolase protein [Xylaria palmicola]
MATAALRTAVPKVADAAAKFQCRTFFDVSPNIVKPYFLGHHVKALRDMSSMLANIDVVIECRDSRVPQTSANPLLEKTLAVRKYILAFTKGDLSGNSGGGGGAAGFRARREALTKSVAVAPGERERPHVALLSTKDRHSALALLNTIKALAAQRAQHSVLPLRALIVGMPNSGKSTLLNTLRKHGTVRLNKVAATGAMPGVTRKLSSPVCIVLPTRSAAPPSSPSAPSIEKSSAAAPSPSPREPDVGDGVYVHDTPGVFIPHVSSPTAMLKLSLVGCIKDGTVPAEVLADYLLFRMNLLDPGLYAQYCPEPTNDVDAFLDAVGRCTGKLGRGGAPSRQKTAEWVVERYRNGHLGRFCLDDYPHPSLREVAPPRQGRFSSMSAAVKADKERRAAKRAKGRIRSAAE